MRRMKRFYYFCPFCGYSTVWDIERINHEEATGHCMVIEEDEGE
jgi:hypothetical protein